MIVFVIQEYVSSKSKSSKILDIVTDFNDAFEIAATAASSKCGKYLEISPDSRLLEFKKGKIEITEYALKERKK